MDILFDKIKKEFGYDDELMDILKRIYIVMINVFGEEYSDKIANAFLNTKIFWFTDVRELSKDITEYFNDGKDYIITSRAIGNGVAEKQVIINDDKTVHHKNVIGLFKSNNAFIQTLVHELCHVVSFNETIITDDEEIMEKEGFLVEKSKIENNKKGKEINIHGELLNEICTEAITVKIMDEVEPDIIHEPTAYAGFTESFIDLFHIPEFESIFIDDYLNCTLNFKDIIYNFISEEEYKDILYFISTEYRNELTQKELEYVSKLQNGTLNDFIDSFLIDNTFDCECPIISEEIISNIGKCISDKKSKKY